MTDQTPAAAPPNLALLKGITAALGLLLVGGVALLCVLLVTRGGSGEADPAPQTVAALPGETLKASSVSEAGILLTFASEDGARLVLIGPDGAVRQEVVVTTAP